MAEISDLKNSSTALRTGRSPNPLLYSPLSPSPVIVSPPLSSLEAAPCTSPPKLFSCYPLNTLACLSFCHCFPATLSLRSIWPPAFPASAARLSIAGGNHMPGGLEPHRLGLWSQMTFRHYRAIFYMSLIDHYSCSPNLRKILKPPMPLHPPHSSQQKTLPPTSLQKLRTSWGGGMSFTYKAPISQLHMPFLCTLRKRAPSLSRLTAALNLTPVSTETWFIGYPLSPEPIHWVILVLPLTSWNKTKWTKKTYFHLMQGLLAFTRHPSFPLTVKFL